MSFTNWLCQPKQENVWKHTTLLCLAHLLFLALAFTLLRIYLGKPVLPAEAELLQWDAEHYHAIMQQGYFGINVAFFPFLPAIWRTLGLNAYGITLLNILIFYGAFVWLSKLLALKRREMLLMLSVPGFMFFYVPYTEALFFVGAVLLLYAIRKENLKLLIFTLLLLSVTRPVISILLPALLLTIFIRFNQSPFYSVKTVFWSLASVLPGLFILAFVQKQHTGNAWGFITIQAEHWHHYLQWPRFPLSTWENSTRLVLLLDGIAFFIALLCVLKVLQQLWIKYKHPDQVLDGVVLFSLLYLAGCGGAILLFQGGSLLSINRYVFATAFFVVVFKHFADHYKFKPVHLLYLFLSLEIFWLLFKSYDRFRTFVRLNLASVYFAGTLAIFHKHTLVRNIAFSVFYIINTVAQVYCLDVFMSGQWVS